MDNNQNETLYSQQPNNGGYRPEVPDDEKVMTMGDWLVTLLVLTFVPCVNIIMMFVWGFGNGNQNRKNFCRAYLIIYAVLFALMLILYITIFASIISSGLLG